MWLPESCTGVASTFFASLFCLFLASQIATHMNHSLLQNTCSETEHVTRGWWRFIYHIETLLKWKMCWFQSFTRCAKLELICWLNLGYMKPYWSSQPSAVTRHNNCRGSKWKDPESRKLGTNRWGSETRLWLETDDIQSNKSPPTRILILACFASLFLNKKWFFSLLLSPDAHVPVAGVYTFHSPACKITHILAWTIPSICS